MTTVNERPYFMQNKDWYYFDEETWTYKLTDQAPKEAVEDYEEFYKTLDDQILLKEGR